LQLLALQLLFLDWVLRRTTERSFTNELGDVTPLGAPSCGFRKQALNNNQAGCESYRRAQGHDEANDLAGSSFLGHRTGRGPDAGAGAVPLSLHPKKLRAVYKAEQFMS
jgi:hypothetical protein